MYSSVSVHASHIVVTTPEAVASGRDVFGLPTVLGSIDFGVDDHDDQHDNTDYGRDNDDDNDDDDEYDMMDEWYTEGLMVGERIGNWIIHRAEEIAVALKYSAGTAIPGIAEPAERLNTRKTKSFPKSKTFVPRGSTDDTGCVWNGDTDIRVNGWNSWEPVSTNNDPVTTNNSTDDNNDKSINKVVVVGDTTTTTTTATNPTPRGGISLPSFSGRLNKRSSSSSTTSNGGSTGNKKKTPLLRYPLRLLSARSIRLRPAMTTTFATTTITTTTTTPNTDARFSEDLRAVLKGPCAIPCCIQVDGVMVVAGKPVEIAS